MIFRWFVPTSRDKSIACLYGAIVAQARQPAFYQAYREVVKNYRFYDQAYLFMEQVWVEQ